MYVDLQENVQKLAKFFTTYSKKKEYHLQNGWIGIKQDHLLFLNQKMKQINKNMNTIIQEYEHIFDEFQAQQTKQQQEMEEKQKKIKQNYQTQLKRILKQQKHKENSLEIKIKYQDQIIKKQQQQLSFAQNVLHNQTEKLDKHLSQYKNKSNQQKIQQINKINQLENELLSKISNFDMLIQGSNQKEIDNSQLNFDVQNIKILKSKSIQNNDNNLDISNDFNFFDKISPSNSKGINFFKKQNYQIPQNQQNQNQIQIQNQIQNQSQNQNQNQSQSQNQNQNSENLQTDKQKLQNLIKLISLGKISNQNSVPTSPNQEQQTQQQNQNSQSNSKTSNSQLQLQQFQNILQQHEFINNSKEFSQLSIFNCNNNSNNNQENNNLEECDQSNISMQKCEGKWDSQLESDISCDNTSQFDINKIDINNAIQVIQQSKVLEQGDVSLSELLAVQEMSFQSPLPSLHSQEEEETENETQNKENSFNYNHVDLEDIMKAKSATDEFSELLENANKTKQNQNQNQNQNNYQQVFKDITCEQINGTQQQNLPQNGIQNQQKENIQNFCYQLPPKDQNHKNQQKNIYNNNEKEQQNLIKIMEVNSNSTQNQNTQKTQDTNLNPKNTGNTKFSDSNYSFSSQENYNRQ
ncbi:hypothetical protein PPERSA_12546 [Pseudocohnilembus persalinus]|uniref:Uncharacterized protein n=1 Tax=Pseudocohnilembus persalinus TaxID=266149 RepID=A0A0V0Q8E2_PSEPJ|nr:hypothetical protein PPERSA_12546 [Pseudocohnilembus persalinus]|eukprot:KRW98437.1 hypothetical protein PPERSA_12546 [Pseudocohnilembus persalinus]